SGRLVSTDPAFNFLVRDVSDGPVQGAEDPFRPTEQARPARAFGPRVKKRLRNALADLPPVQYVEDPRSVITGVPPGRVIGRGVLVTLGPIRGSATRVEVGHRLWVSGLAARWLTYVVELGAGHWEIDGPT